MSAAVSLSQAAGSWTLQDEQVAKITVNVAEVYLQNARNHLRRVERGLLEVLRRADERGRKGSDRVSEADRRAARAAGIALGDARERVMHGIAIVLRAQQRLAEVMDRRRHDSTCACGACRVKVTP